MDIDILEMQEEEFRELICRKSIPETYSESVIIRSLVQMIPVIGPLIDGLMAKPGSVYQKERSKKFLLSFYYAFKKIEEKIDRKIIEENKKWLCSEAFHDMFYAGYNSAIKSRSIEKLIISVMILTNIISVENEGKYIPEEYLY